MTPKPKRPKVRYVATGSDEIGWMIRHNAKGYMPLSGCCGCYSRSCARRIAAALNLYEAKRRGEL